MEQLIGLRFAGLALQGQQALGVGEQVDRILRRHGARCPQVGKGRGWIVPHQVELPQGAQMARVLGAGAADRGEHAQLRRFQHQYWFAGGRLQLRQRLVRRWQKFTLALTAGLWHQGPRFPAQTRPP